MNRKISELMFLFKLKIFEIGEPMRGADRMAVCIIKGPSVVQIAILYYDYE